MRRTHANATVAAIHLRWLELLFLLLAAALYGLCFLHLRADFPNFSPWNDWSKMTDEGWYGGAAIHHFVQGQWYLPGSFNPAVAMPVWPALLSGWFAITGVSMEAARALTVVIYGVSLLLLYLLVRRAAGDLTAASAVFLMAANPFCYAFDRLAVLEPVLVLWLLLGLCIGGTARLQDLARPVLLGGTLVLLVLTKTTGLFLAPAIAYHFWASNGWPRRGWLRPAVMMGFSALMLWLAYYLLAVRPHYLSDFHLLFSINHDRVHLSIVPREAWNTLKDGRWINVILFPAALLAVLWSFTGGRALLKIPLFGSALIATTGYLVFIGYHSNLQPRYYLVVTAPVVIVVVLALNQLWQRRAVWVAGLATGVLAVTCVAMAVATLKVVAHPQYSFVSAAADIAAKIRAQPDSSGVLLSNSGDDVTLFTGIPAIPVEYSTRPLPSLLDRYRPDWAALWSGREDKWAAQLGRRYRLVEVAHYTVFDDPERDRLLLYRLIPIRP